MLNRVRNLFAGSDVLTTKLVLLAVVFAVGFGCLSGGRDKEVKPIPSEFVGEWVSSGGSKLSIRGDSGADFHEGGTDIQNATAEYSETEKVLKLTYFGFAVKTFQVDQAPVGNQMKLDSAVYKRSGGANSEDNGITSSGASTSTDSESGNSETRKNGSVASSGGTPRDEEVGDLVQNTLQEFADAIDEEDFTNFRDGVSKPFHDQFTADKFKSSFQEFIDRKSLFVPIIRSTSDMTSDFTSGPTIERESGYKVLKVSGEYATSPLPTKFDFKYLNESGEWKLLRIEVRIMK
jgi:hypothetical protein